MADDAPTTATEPETLPRAVQDAPGEVSRGRRIALWVLLVVFTVLLFLAAAVAFVDRQIVDQDAFTEASKEMLADEEIRAAISTYAVNQLYDNVDIQGELESRLPEDYQGIAGPLSAALRGPARTAVDTLLSTSQFQDVWVAVTGAAHAQLIAILEGGGDRISTEEGQVTLDLGQVVTNVGERLGLSDSLLDKIPEDAGTITIVESSNLGAAQDVYDILQTLSWLLIALVIVLFVVILWIARGYRRETLRNLGISFLLVGVLLLVARGVVRNVLLDQLLDQPTFEPAAARAFLIATEVLASLGWALILYGIVFVFGAFVAGPSRAGTAVRRFVAPVSNARPEIAWGAIALLYLFLVWWAPTPAFRTWWGVLFFAALLAVGWATLGRQTKAEFPELSVDGGAASLAGGARGAWTSATSRLSGSDLARLERLNELRRQGAITEEEYEAQKRRLLGGDL